MVVKMNENPNQIDPTDPTVDREVSAGESPADESITDRQSSAVPQASAPPQTSYIPKAPGVPETPVAPPPPQQSVYPQPGPSAQTGTAAAPPYGVPTVKVPYMGGIPVRCPRCSNVVNTRVCPYCGLDLATVYTVSQPAAAQQHPYYPQPTPQQPAYHAAPAAPQNQYSYSYQQVPQAQVPPQGQYAQPQSYPYPPAGNAPTGNVPPGTYPPTGTVPTPGTNGKKSHKTTWIICGISLFFVVVFIFAFLLFRGLLDRADPGQIDFGDDYRTPGAEEYYYSGGVSLKEYSQLREGMTYARISKIIGGDGTLVDSGVNLDGDDYYIYGWPGESDPNVEVYVTFIDDEATEITNNGLTD